MQQDDVHAFAILDCADRLAVHEGTIADDQTDHAVFHARDMQVLRDFRTDRGPRKGRRRQVRSAEHLDAEEALDLLRQLAIPHSRVTTRTSGFMSRTRIVTSRLA